MSARDRGVSTEAGTALDAEGPLRRWARRKREVAREKEAEDEARRRDEGREPSDAAGDARESADDASEPAVIEEKVLTDEDMPPLDSLDENSDYSGFLSSGVSEALRRRALRKLFSSAVFNIPDGLDDYDDDFTSFAALGDIVTSDMKHQAEMEAERAKRAQAGAEPSTDVEGGARAAGDGQPAPASDDATVHAEAGRAGAAERTEPAACADPGPPDAAPDEGEHEDDAGDRERSVSPAGAGRRSGESVASAGSPAGREAPDDVETAGRTRGEAAGGGESPASSGPPEDGSRASAGSGPPAKAGKAHHRGA